MLHSGCGAECVQAVGSSIFFLVILFYSFFISCLPLEVVFHRKLSSIEGCLSLKVVFHRRSSFTEGRLPLKAVFHSIFSRGHIVSGAHCLQGHIVFLGRAVSIAHSLGGIPSWSGESTGKVVTGAGCLRGMFSPGVSPRHIVSRGALSPKWIISVVLRHIVSGQIVSRHHVPPPLCTYIICACSLMNCSVNLLFKICYHSHLKLTNTFSGFSAFCNLR